MPGGDPGVQPADSPDPVSALVAAERLGKAPGTIYSWATRYGVRKWHQDKRTFFDYWDLATIDVCLNAGVDVPPTPAERDVLRAESRKSHAA
jgi:hypothetical protein